MDILKVVVAGIVFFVLFTIGASFETVVKYTRVKDYFINRFGEKGAYNVFNVLIVMACLPCFVFFVYAVKEYVPDMVSLPRYTTTVGAVIMATGALIYFYNMRFLKSFRWMGRNVFGVAEEKDVMITEGAYKYIRHPTYLGCIVLFYGIFFIIPWVMVLIMCISFHLYMVFIHSRIEERELLEKFGDKYSAYMEKTPGFIPRPWKYRGGVHE